MFGGCHELLHNSPPPVSQGMPPGMSTQWVLALKGCMLRDWEVSSIHGNYMPIFDFFSFLVSCSLIISMHVSHATSFLSLTNPPIYFALLSHYLPLLSGPPCPSLYNPPLTLQQPVVRNPSSQPEFATRVRNPRSQSAADYIEHRSEPSVCCLCVFVLCPCVLGKALG